MDASSIQDRFSIRRLGTVSRNLVVPLILLVLSLVSAASAQVVPQYANSPVRGKAFMADAPWRVKGENVPIPIGFSIHGADVSDLEHLDSLEVVLFRDGDKRIYFQNWSGVRITDRFWAHTVMRFAGAESPYDVFNGEFITPERLGFHAGESMDLEARIRGRDEGGDVTFSRRLRLVVGNPFPRPDSSWLYGDAHYHTQYTSNPYEYGGSLETTKYALDAMDIDWITATDHASDTGDWDLNTERWGELRDWIDQNNNDSGLPVAREGWEPFIIGEEITCQAHAGNPLGGDIHLLVYNNDRFISGEIAADFPKFDLDSRLNKLNATGLAFAAHPRETYVFTEEWSDENFETAFGHSNFYGLEVWNGRTTMHSPGGSFDNINPFTGPSGGWEDQYSERDEDHFLHNLKAGIKAWEKLLVTHLNPIRKVVINAGSDAHGDMNYASKTGVSSNFIQCNDNALGKVRTLVYAPRHPGESIRTSILEGLRHGHSIITDGPVLLIGIDNNKDQSLNPSEGDFIVGDVVSLGRGDGAEIMITWMAYEDIKIDRITLYLDGKRIHRFSPENDTDVVGDAFQGYKIYAVPMSVKPGDHYVRAECQTEPFESKTSPGFLDRYRAYTNPLWLSVASPTKVTTVTVRPTAVTFSSPGTRQLTATATYNDASTEDVTTKANWTSSNPKVATVDSAGLVTASGRRGSAKIRARYQGKKGTCVVTFRSEE